jgi:hypothetical protein
VIPGLGTVLFTAANDPAHYIEAGTVAGTGDIVHYFATAVVWAAPEASAVPEPSSLLLAATGIASALLLRRRTRHAHGRIAHHHD